MRDRFFVSAYYDNGERSPRKTKREEIMNLKGKKGVDISSLNGNVSIEKIKDAGYDFVMIRCGYGSDLAVQDDSQFENNVRKCEAAGVPSFFRPRIQWESRLTFRISRQELSSSDSSSGAAITVPSCRTAAKVY